MRNKTKTASKSAAPDQMRAAAAEALLNKGLAAIEGPAGAALAQAQAEWAESLRTFNDDPRDQTTLGWLESARGRSEAAEQALNAAIRLDPAAARPHVLLGVLFARARLPEHRSPDRRSPEAAGAAAPLTGIEHGSKLTRHASNFHKLSANLSRCNGRWG